MYIAILSKPHTLQTAYTAGYHLGVQTTRDNSVFGTSLHPFRRSTITNSYDINSLLGIHTSSSYFGRQLLLLMRVRRAAYVPSNICAPGSTRCCRVYV
jgi:hypothetical protein